jgi:hypothetical protein
LRERVRGVDPPHVVSAVNVVLLKRRMPVCQELGLAGIRRIFIEAA